MIIDKYELSTKLRMLKPIIPRPKDEGLIAGVTVENGWLKVNNAITKMEIKLDTKCDETFVIPGIALDLIDSLPNGNVEIKETNNLIVIKSSKGGTYKYAKIETENVFVLEAEDAEPVITVDAELFKALVKKGLFPCSEKNKAPYNGMLFKGENGNIDIVACDGFNMTWNKLESDTEVNMVIPCDTIKRVLSIEYEGNVEILKTAKMVVIKDENVILTSKLCDGNFLNYAVAFPKIQPNEIKISKEELLSSCKRAEKVNDKRAACLVISKRSDTEITLELVSSTTTFEEVLDYEGTLEDDFKIGVNPQYLIENISAIDAELVTIGFGNAVQPICFSEDDYRGLTLPVRLKKAGASK